jgi:hypothetical protein
VKTFMAVLAHLVALAYGIAFILAMLVVLAR